MEQPMVSADQWASLMDVLHYPEEYLPAWCALAAVMLTTLLANDVTTLADAALRGKKGGTAAQRASQWASDAAPALAIAEASRAHAVFLDACLRADDIACGACAASCFVFVAFEGPRPSNYRARHAIDVRGEGSTKRDTSDHATRRRRGPDARRRRVF